MNFRNRFKSNGSRKSQDWDFNYASSDVGIDVKGLITGEQIEKIDFNSQVAIPSDEVDSEYLLKARPFI